MFNLIVWFRDPEPVLQKKESLVQLSFFLSLERSRGNYSVEWWTVVHQHRSDCFEKIRSQTLFREKILFWRNEKVWIKVIYVKYCSVRKNILKKWKGLEKSDQMNGLQLARGRTSEAAVNRALQIKANFFVEANADLDQISQAFTKQVIMRS